MRFFAQWRLSTVVIILPCLVAVACAYARWHRDQYQIVEETLHYSVISGETDLKSWKARWEGQLEDFTRVGGCDCCVTTYRIRGPRIAIESFPMNSMSRHEREQQRQSKSDRTTANAR